MLACSARAQVASGDRQAAGSASYASGLLVGAEWHDILRASGIATPGGQAGRLARAGPALPAGTEYWPVGGITPAALAGWIKAGASGFGLGGRCTVRASRRPNERQARVLLSLPGPMIWKLHKGLGLPAEALFRSRIAAWPWNFRSAAMVALYR